MCLPLSKHSSGANSMKRSSTSPADTINKLTMNPQSQSPDPDSTTSNSEELALELYDINLIVADKYHAILISVLANHQHPVTQYLKNRGVRLEEITEWKLGFAPDEWTFMTDALRKADPAALERAVEASICQEKDGRRYDFFRNRLMIPLLDEQRRVVSFTGRSLGDDKPKYLNTRETPVFKKSELLFGLDKAFRSIARSGTVVLTEGNFDVISLHRVGITEAVGKGGTALTDAQVATLKRIAKIVLLIYDVDVNGAGQRALAKDCERLLEAGLRVQVFFIPEPADGSKIDADTYVQQQLAEHPVKGVKDPKWDLSKLQKYAKEGLIWLAETWYEPDNVAGQVDGEERGTKLLAQVQNDVWLNKYAKILARLFECKSSDLIKKAQRIRQAPDQQKSDEEEPQSARIRAVQYRRDVSIWVYGNRNWVCVADNFQVFIRYKTETENQDVSWILEIQRKGSDPLFLKVTHEEFCSAGKLKVKLAGVDLAFKISDAYIGELHQHLFELGYPKATEVTRLGYHADSGVFFFANKAMNGKLLDPDEHGIVVSTNEEGKSIYLTMPQQSKNLKKNQTFFRYSDGDMTFNQWFEHLSAVHKYDNAIVPACFYLMALYRDVVVRHTNTCPMLYLKGGPSSGKSSIVRSMCQLFGYKEPAANLKSRVLEAALLRKFSQLSNALVWLEEMTNEFEYQGVLQGAYDNTGYSRSSDSTSHETNSVDIYSAVAITSNYLLDEDALFTRSVFIPIIEQQKTEQQAIDYKKLDDLQINGLACVTVEMLQHRELIETHFPSAYQRLYSHLQKAVRHEKVVVRLISNLAQVLTVAFILQLHGKITVMEYGDPEEILNEFVTIGARVILRQHQIASEKSNLTDFFEIMQGQYEMGYLFEDTHFKFHGPDVWLRFPVLYRIYAEKYRKSFFKAPADRDTLKSEMAGFEGFTQEDKFFKPIRFHPLPEETATDRTRPISDCCSMNYRKLQEAFGLDLESQRNTPKIR